MKKRKIDLNHHSPFYKFITPLFLSRLLVLLLCILLFLSLYPTPLSFLYPPLLLLLYVLKFFFFFFFFLLSYFHQLYFYRKLHITADGSAEESTPSCGDVVESPSNREYDETSAGPIGKTESTDPSVEKPDDPDLPEVLPEGHTNKEESETLVEVPGNRKQAEISVEEAPCDEEKTKDKVVEPCNKKYPDAPMEIDSSAEAADTPVEAQSLDQGETNVPAEICHGVEHPKEGETQTDSSGEQLYYVAYDHGSFNNV